MALSNIFQPIDQSKTISTKQCKWHILDLAFWVMGTFVNATSELRVFFSCHLPTYKMNELFFELYVELNILL